VEQVESRRSKLLVDNLIPRLSHSTCKQKFESDEKLSGGLGMSLKLVEVTILAVLFCFSFEWVGLFSRERVLAPPPSLSRHLSSSPMGILSRAYGTSITPLQSLYIQLQITCKCTSSNMSCLYQQVCKG